MNTDAMTRPLLPGSVQPSQGASQAAYPFDSLLKLTPSLHVGGGGFSGAM